MLKKLSAFLFFILFLSVAAAEEGDAPVVEFYYSTTDPHIAATEKAVVEVMKKYPNIPLERICIDDKKGLKRLQRQEQALDIKNLGDRTLIFGPWALTARGDSKDIETLFGGMMERMIKQSKGDMSHKDRLNVNAALVPGYVKEVYGPDAAFVAPQGGAKFESNVFYEVKKDGKRAGWVIDAYDPIGCPICSSTQFFVAADAKGTILGVKPIREIERVGNKLPDAETEKFTSQFKGKTPADHPLKVDGITRATKTVHAYSSALADILEELKKKAKE